MTPEQKTVECETCHARMAIPPGYEQMEGKCPKCGGVVNRQAQPAQSHAGVDALDVNLGGPAQPTVDPLSELGGG